MTREHYPDKASWLKGRKGSIGASDASCILGVNPWASVDKLYNEKVGLVDVIDISDKPAVKFGTDAEEHIRNLVAMDFPECVMFSRPFDILHHDIYTFITATLDGVMVYKACPIEAIDLESMDHIPAELLQYIFLLEVKTGSFRSLSDLEEWENGMIPQHYFCQVVQQLIVTGYPKALVVARLKREAFKDADDGLPEVRWYYRWVYANSPNVIESMQTIIEADILFQKHVETKTRPDTIIYFKGDATWTQTNQKTRW